MLTPWSFKRRFREFLTDMGFLKNHFQQITDIGFRKSNFELFCERVLNVVREEKLEYTLTHNEDHSAKWLCLFREGHLWVKMSFFDYAIVYKELSPEGDILVNERMSNMEYGFQYIFFAEELLSEIEKNGTRTHLY